MEVFFVGEIGIRIIPRRETYDLGAERHALNFFVGAIGFEPTTSCSQSKRASRTAPRPDINIFSNYEALALSAPRASSVFDAAGHAPLLQARRV